MSTFSGLSWSAYTRSTICVLGLFSNVVNVSVLVHRKFKNRAYKATLVKAVLNTLILALSLASEFLITCSDSCSWTRSYSAVLYSIIVGSYFEPCLAFFKILIDIYLLAHAYCLLADQNWTRKFSYWVVLIFLGIVSVAFYAQVPFVYLVESNPTGTFLVTKTSFGNSNDNRTLTTAQSIVKYFLAVIFLSLSNIIGLLQFRRRFTNRVMSNANLRANTSSQIFHTGKWSATVSQAPSVAYLSTGFPTVSNYQEAIMVPSKVENSVMVRNISQMVLASVFTDILSQVPNAITYIIGLSGLGLSSYHTATSVAAIFALIPSFTDFFIYYLFNFMFKNMIRSYFRIVALILKNLYNSIPFKWK